MQCTCVLLINSSLVYECSVRVYCFTSKCYSINTNSSVHVWFSFHTKYFHNSFVVCTYMYSNFFFTNGKKHNHIVEFISQLFSSVHLPGNSEQWMSTLVVSAQVRVIPPIMAAILSASEHARYLIARRLLFNCVCTSACSKEVQLLQWSCKDCWCLTASIY